MHCRPEDVHHALAQAYGSGDLDALMALFEEGAALVPMSGEVVHGRDAIRNQFAILLANRSQFVLGLEQVVEAGDVTLLVSRWTVISATPTGHATELSGRTSDVVRRQRDGTWRLVIDHPYGGLRAELETPEA